MGGSSVKDLRTVPFPPPGWGFRGQAAADPNDVLRLLRESYGNQADAVFPGVAAKILRDLEGGEDLIGESLSVKPEDRKASLRLVTRPRLRILTPEELLNPHQETREYLIDSLIPKGSSTLTTGRPKGGKSWLALFMSVDVATGRPFLGRFNVPRPTRVLFLEEEDTRQRLEDRFRRIILARQGRGPDGEYLRFSCRSGFTFSSSEMREDLHRVIAEFQPELVIVDVLRSVFRGDVTASKDVAPFLRHVDELRDRFGLAVNIVAHNRKRPRGRDRDRAEDAVEEVLGATDLAAWADVIIRLERIGEEQEDSRETAFKVQVVSKDGVEPPFEIMLEGDRTEPVSLRYVGTIRETRDAKTRQKIIEALRAMGTDGQEFGIKALAEAAGVSRNTLSDHLPALLEAGWLIPINTGSQWPRYRVRGGHAQ